VFHDHTCCIILGAEMAEIGRSVCTAVKQMAELVACMHEAKRGAWQMYVHLHLAATPRSAHWLTCPSLLPALVQYGLTQTTRECAC
jgi:hypothetical protein